MKFVYCRYHIMCKYVISCDTFAMLMKVLSHNLKVLSFKILSSQHFLLVPIRETSQPLPFFISVCHSVASKLCVLKDY